MAMASDKITLKDFIENGTLFEEKKKKPKKPKKTEYKKSIYNPGGLADAWFTSGLAGANSGAGSFGGTSPGGVVGESLLSELFAGIMGGATPSSVSANVLQTSQLGKNRNSKDAGMTTYPSEDDDYEEEPEMKAAKVDQARQLFQAMFNRPNATRADIINAFMKDVGVTNSTAVSYYTRFLDEFGLSSKDQPEALGQGVAMGGGDDITAAGAPDETLTPPVEDTDAEMEEPLDPNRAGIIRTVDNAHLVYKRQAENGTYEELWIYNIHDATNDELDIRRDILAGTDIPAKKTKSADGAQSYSVSTMGNAQMLKISGLPN